jgi:hypothetical protein
MPVGWVKAALVGAGLLMAGAVIVAQVLYRLELRSARHARAALLARPPAAAGRFGPELLTDLPEPARRYLTHAIAPGTPLKMAVELEMTGQFGLGDRDRHRMLSMRARQALAPPHGFVWMPVLSAGLMRISGSDGCAAGEAWTRFWLLWTIPLVRASGTPDLARSAAARAIMEAIWVPASLLPQNGARWEQLDRDTARVTFDVAGEPLGMTLAVSPEGRPLTVAMMRWSDANPDKVFRWQPFGGTIEAVGSFEGYTIPTRVRVGNHYGTDRYFAFFVADIVAARYR